ncbi:MAG TPA: carboxymuconolactone decarboxylase family protein [Kiloniellaceae bacterium]|nr:carboxymuconolactone decarboxylase family protein [Kiloniellaceae bacterium]
MPRISPVDRSNASGDAKTLLDAVHGGLGMVPNIFATMAHAPKALEGILGLNKALGGGLLPAQLREQIALTVAGYNGCDYCASAHSALGKGAGLSADDLARGLAGDARDPKAATALRFVRKVVADRGRIGDSDLQALQAAGFGNGEIVEIVAHIGLNIFTNYFNHIADTAVDFPLVRAEAATAAA